MSRLLLLALPLAGAPAVAAEPPWAAAPPPKLPERLHLTLDRFRHFTDCIADDQWEMARPLFATRVGSPDESRILSRLTGGGYGSKCTYAFRMRMTSMLMRGGIAESRYRQVFGDTPPAPAAGEPTPVPAGASFRWVGFQQDSNPRHLYAFATCLARTEPAGVHTVLKERIGSKGERLALQALSGRFGACLAPGQRLQANSLTLRPWLAEAQYQRFRSRDSGQPVEASE